MVYWKLGITLTLIEEFFTVQKGKIPSVDIGSWRLIVDGCVEKPLTLTYEELKTLPQNRIIEVLECYDNTPDGKLIGVAEWEGILVSKILEIAKPKVSASHLLFHSLDGYSTNHRIEYVKRACVMLALKMNGMTLPIKHGYPVRLVAPGMYGYKWAKWINRIEVLEGEELGYWEKRGYPSEPYRGLRTI
ncbi:MAG: molybdopterin-dependent oxidoreductase [Candidatus Bathyarchaeia archaeon]